MTERAVSVQVPAKVNLALGVGEVRPDGFHDLATVYLAVNLLDDVAAVEARPGVFTVTTRDPAGNPVPGVPDDERHLAVRAARRLAGELGDHERKRLGVHLRVTKRIPVAGGMAGGSADAAGALAALNRLWGARLGRDRLLALAAELGSDVPFAMLGGVALGTGRGERVSSVAGGRPTWWVVMPAEGGLSTPQVYGRLDTLRADGLVGPPTTELRPLLEALAAGDVPAIGDALVNDLQPAALDLRPDLAGTLERAMRCGALATLVSGSGPTCLALAKGAAHAYDLAETLGQQVAGSAPAPVVTSGPVEGALVRQPRGSSAS